MKRKPGSRRKVAIIGSGLIGASIGLALLRNSKRHHVVGWDRLRAHSRAAQARRAFHKVASSLDAAISGADIVILAVPLAAVVALLPRVMSRAKGQALIMDVAGLKRPVIAGATRALKGGTRAAFIGGHPLAGSEHSGPHRATSQLFEGRPFALCAPRQRMQAAALRRACTFVRLLGASPVVVAADRHDRVVAATSAVPQITSSALALAVNAADAGRTRLVGPGFESSTRLAMCDPGLWTASLLANQRNVRRALTVFEARVRDFRSAIEHNDAASLGRLLRSAAAARQRLKRS